jgi:SNF2 family DNA or RNA helicase
VPRRRCLTLLELLLHHLAIAFCRLDGSTPVRE